MILNELYLVEKYQSKYVVKKPPIPDVGNAGSLYTLSIVSGSAPRIINTLEKKRQIINFFVLLYFELMNHTIANKVIRTIMEARKKRW